MKKFLIYSFLLLGLSRILQAQGNSKTSVVYGKVNRNVILKTGNYQIPAANIKILLVEASYSGLAFNKSICNKSPYPAQVKVFMTDSKGEYNFRGARKGVKYRLIICDTKSDKAYFTDLKIPLSANDIVRVPDRNL